MYSKRYKIQYRIIRREDITGLSHFLERLAKTQGGTCSFRVVFRDRSSIEDHHAQFFNDSCFTRKDVSNIEFEYVSADYKSQIELRLEEGNVPYTEMNSFHIRSEDENWLNATYVKLVELIDGIPSHSIFRKSFSFPWVFANYAAIQTVSWKAMSLFGFSYGERPLLPDGSPNPDCLFISANSFFLISSVAFLLLTGIVCFLYPEQEFAFGVSRYFYRIRARKLVGWLLATILVPIALTVLS